MHARIPRFISSESQGQEEACARPAYTITSELFTVTNIVKFTSAVTCHLEFYCLASYYRAT